MKWEIKELSEIYKDDIKKWGNKAYCLSSALNRGVSVVKGYGISFCLDTNNYVIENEELLLQREKQIFEELVSDCKLIVRSSADIEDRKNCSLPGVFESIGDVDTFEKLVDAVKQCVNGAMTIKWDKYIEVYKTEISMQYFCVLIQMQKNVSYSGVAFTKVPIQAYYLQDSMMTEFVKGYNWELLQGREKGNTYLLSTKGTAIKIRCLKQIEEMDKSSIDVLLKKLYIETDKIKKIFGNELDIEWGYEKEIYIFQIRPTYIINFEKEKIMVKDNRVLFPIEEKKWG